MNDADEDKGDCDGRGQESLLSVSSHESQDDINQPQRGNDKPDGGRAHIDWRIASRPTQQDIADCSRFGTFFMKKSAQPSADVYSKQIPL
jgi:hypothetical protein